MVTHVLNSNDSICDSVCDLPAPVDRHLRLVDSSAAPPEQRLRSFLRTHGRSTLARSTLQADAEQFEVAGRGYVAYMPLRRGLLAPRGLRVVLGEPVCAVEDYDAVLDAFVEDSGSRTVAFLDFNHDFAQVLARRGHIVNEMGVEWDIDPRTFDPTLPGKEFAHLRRWRNKARKSGVRVVEGRMSTLLAERGDELMALNEQWLSTKGGREMVGLTRPMVLHDEPDVRYLWALGADDELVGLTVLDPVYRDGALIGYMHNLARTAPHAVHGTNDLMVLEALARLRDDGCELLSLGLSPFAALTDGEFRHRRSVARLFHFLHERCQFIYPFKGNLFHKERYRGRPRTVYMAALPDLHVLQIPGFMKALGIF